MRKALTLPLGLILLMLPACGKKQPVSTYHPTPQQIQAVQPPQSTKQQDSIQELLNQAYQEWAHVPHRDGGLSKEGIDCSGFVHIVFKTKLHQDVPRTTRTLATTGSPITQNQLQPGDLIFFKIRRKVNHVGIYTGNDSFIHASKSKGVWRSRLSLKYWQDHYWQSRRVLD